MNSFEYLDLEQAEAYVKSESARGRTIFWDAWDLVTWRPNSAGYLRSDGAFMHNRWGIKRVIKPDRYGKYRVSGKYRITKQSATI